jgi:hypothetical protein
MATKAAGGPNRQKINVFVDNGLLWVDREPIYMWGANAEIEWVLGTSGYEFHANTISVHGNDHGELAKKSGNKTSHVLSNKNTFPQSYKYTISVLNSTGGPHPPALDPSIVNQA